MDFNTDLYREVAEGMLRYCRKMSEKGFAEGTSGNISYRFSEEVFLVTPTMFAKEDVTEKDLCFVDASGKIIPELMERYGHSSEVKPTSEFMTHLAVYASDPDIRALVLTHPPFTCSYAFTDHVPSEPMGPESAIWMGRLEMIPYFVPGTSALADAVAKAAAGKKVMVMQNHGLLTWGKNLKEAYFRTEIVEYHCRVTHLIESRNERPNVFSEQELADLKERYQ